MAGNFKLSVMVALFVYGVMLLDQPNGRVDAKVCPLYCLKVAYMTCPSSGEKHLPASCNCCLSNAPKGCILHLADGSLYPCK